MSIIPSADLQEKIMAKWANAPGERGDANSFEKIGFLVSQHMDQLDIVPVNSQVFANGQEHEGGGGGQKPLQILVPKFSTFNKLWVICAMR